MPHRLMPTRNAVHRLCRTLDRPHGGGVAAGLTAWLLLLPGALAVVLDPGPGPMESATSARSMSASDGMGTDGLMAGDMAADMAGDMGRDMGDDGGVARH